MKSIYSAIFIASAILLIASCNNAESAGKGESPTVKIADNDQDSIALTKLVRQVYKWYEKNAHNSDFSPKTNTATDTLYNGIDWTAYNKRVKTIKESNYFDKSFIDNYQKIAEYLDTALKSGREIWPVNELPSFGFDVNPWCGCQDYPDNYWDIIKVTDLKVVNNTATFSWTWGDGFTYKTSATKNNGAWKISYLEGFKPDNFKSK
jgi:hypothetical protein